MVDIVKDNTKETTNLKNADTDYETLLNKEKDYSLSSAFEIENPKIVNNYQSTIDDDLNYIYDGPWPIAKNSMIIGLEYAIVFITTLSRDLICFAFCRDKGFAVVESVTAMSVIFDLFCCMLPWSVSSLYMYNAAEAYAAGNSKLLGILTNKLNFILLIFGISMSILFSTIVEPIYMGISTNLDATNHLTAIMRWVSVGLTFWYLQFSFVKYIGVIGKGFVGCVISLTSVGCQVLWLIIFIVGFNIIDLGVGGSISFGFLISFTFKGIYIYIFKPHPESIINPLEGVFKDFWSFLCNSVYVGLTIFLTYFTIDFLPFFAIIISDESYTVMNMLVIVILFFTCVSEGLNIGNNVLVNYVIGKQTYPYIYNVFIVNLIIIAIYSITTAAVVSVLLNYICLLFTDDQSIIDIAANEKVYLFFTIILASFHTLFSETVLICGGETWGLISICVGRFGISISITLILIYTNFGPSSVLLGFIVGQVVTLLMNFSYMYYLFRNNYKQLNINMLIMSTRYDKLMEHENINNFIKYNGDEYKESTNMNSKRKNE